MKSVSPKGSYKSLALAFSNWGLRWQGLIDNRQGEWWLIGQILILTAHLLPPWPLLIDIKLVWPIGLTILGICLLILGVILAAKAFLSLGANLSPLTKPKPGAILVTKGSYKSCRHPLYQSLLISSSGVMIALGSFLHLLLLLSLTALLISKAKKEEESLRKKYLDYASYLESTPAIIQGVPFLDWRT